MVVALSACGVQGSVFLPYGCWLQRDHRGISGEGRRVRLRGSVPLTDEDQMVALSASNRFAASRDGGFCRRHSGYRLSQRLLLRRVRLNRLCPVYETLFWWLRSPSDGKVASAIMVQATGTLWTGPESTGSMVAQARGVAFGFDVLARKHLISSGCALRMLTERTTGFWL